MSETIKNEVSGQKMFDFGIRTFQDFHVALWDSKYSRGIHFLDVSTSINRDDKRIYYATQKLFTTTNAIF